MLCVLEYGKQELSYRLAVLFRLVLLLSRVLRECYFTVMNDWLDKSCAEPVSSRVVPLPTAVRVTGGLKPQACTVMSLRMSIVPKSVILLVLPFIVTLVHAHGHHDELSEEETHAPVDSILWIHMFLQAAVWGLLFPVGMVLGITRSRWHVPLQVCSRLYTSEFYY